MSKVSIIIPSRNETYLVNSGETVLQRTIRDVYEKCTGDFEVLIAFDGLPYQDLPDYPNLKLFRHSDSWGLKRNLNLLVREAEGKYIFKIDSHCMLSEGIDEILQSTMEDNWIVTPRMYVLDAEEWKWQDDRFYDYFRLPCPFTDKKIFRFQAGGHWKERTRERLDISIDENMKLHGSSFFIARDFFVNYIGGTDETWVHHSYGEDIELSMKTWLGPWDGKLMTNKLCWYAHMHKGGQRPRGWGVSWKEVDITYVQIATYWMSNLWEKQVHDIEWLIDKFSPIPGWPENWKELYREWKSI